MYTSENVDVYKKVHCVSTRKGHTHICEFAQHGFMYKNIDIYIYTCEYVFVYKEFQSVHWQGGDTCDFAQLEFIYKSICHTIYVYLWIYVSYTKRF